VPSPGRVAKRREGALRQTLRIAFPHHPPTLHGLAASGPRGITPPMVAAGYQCPPFAGRLHTPWAWRGSPTVVFRPGPPLVRALCPARTVSHLLMHYLPAGGRAFSAPSTLISRVCSCLPLHRLLPPTYPERRGAAVACANMTQGLHIQHVNTADNRRDAGSALPCALCSLPNVPTSAWHAAHWWTFERRRVSLRGRFFLLFSTLPSPRVSVTHCIVPLWTPNTWGCADNTSTFCNHHTAACACLMLAETLRARRV